jgi:hypothetical protein
MIKVACVFPFVTNEWEQFLQHLDVEVVALKSYSLSGILYILKELEYTLLIIFHLEGYYFIYYL